MSLNLFPWERCDFLSIIQFPYRLNIISTLLLSFVAGYSVINAFENKEDVLKIITLVILIIAAKQLSEVKINENSITYEILMSGPLVANGEYKPIGFSEDDKYVYNLNASDTKIHFEKKGSKINFNYEDLENNLEIHVPLTYYKGYSAYIIKENGEKVELNVKKDTKNAHLIIYSDQKLTGNINVEYKMTIVQKIGYTVSILTLVALIIYIVYTNKNNSNIDKSLKNKRGILKEKILIEK